MSGTVWAMGHLMVIVPTAVVVFASTNIDDLVLLTFLFLAYHATSKPRPWQVIVGQCAGITLLVASAAVAGFALIVVPARWVGLLGLVPLSLGVWKLIKAGRQSPGDDPAPVVTGLAGVVSVAVVNGTDNLAVYTPLFRTFDTDEVLVTLAVFVAMVGLWCVVAAWLGSRLAAVATLRRLSHRLTPVVFIAIGAIILATMAIP